jgi:hypothetical protein
MDFHKTPRQEHPPVEESLDTVFAQAETRLRDFIAQAKPVREGGGRLGRRIVRGRQRGV